jgi:hypothetical protein
MIPDADTHRGTRDSGSVGSGESGEAPAVEVAEASPPTGPIPLTATKSLSYSRLSRYNRCGRAFELQYIEKVPMLTSGAALAGKAVHEVNEQMVAEGWWRDPKAVEEVGGPLFLSIFARLVEEEGGADALLWGGRKRALRDEQTNKVIKDAEGNTILVGEDFTWFSKMGPTFVKRAGTILRSANEVGLYVVEASMERRVTVWLDPPRPVDDYGGIQVTGIIDIMLMADDVGTPWIVDWKTGTYIDEMQLAVYAWLLENIEDENARVRTNAGAIAYLRGASPDTWWKPYDLTPLKPLVPVQFKNLVRALDAGIYMLQPSSFCGSCWVKEHCEYGRVLEARKVEAS